MNGTVVQEKQHARLSPSGAKRWLTCPGSIKFVEALNIEEKPSKYAAEGTVAHEIHELALLNNNPAKFYLGKKITADGMSFKVNQEMVDAVQASLDYVYARIDEAKLDGLEVELLVEVRSSLEYLGIPGLDGGTSDLVLIFRDGDEIVEVEVFDYKHGAGVLVDPVNNPQAMCYALGICAKYQLEGVPVRVTISQPRARNGDPINYWETNSDELLNWQEETLVPGALATQQDDAELVPSEDACRFCKGSAQCPKLYDRTQEVAMIDFDTVDDEVNMPAVETLSAEQKKFIMKHGDMIRAFIVAVEEQVKTEVDHGSQDYQDEYKLVRKSTRRKFVDDALDELTSPLLDHLEREDLFEEKPRSMTEIEKRLKKAIGAKDAKEVMEDVTTKPEGDLVIAPLSDKRKEVKASVISDFTNL